MNETTLEQNLTEALIREWEIIPTGSGFLVVSDWLWPNHERIEIHVRTVGEREDLFVVTEGGELFNFLFSQGIDLTRDEKGQKAVRNVLSHYGAELVDFQIVKGAGEGDLAQAIRLLVEAVKDASFVLWHRLEAGGDLPIH